MEATLREIRDKPNLTNQPTVTQLVKAFSEGSLSSSQQTVISHRG